ncbi:hypothetical protein GCM10028807_58110 [Spirosoma daeguense]
MTLPKSVLLMVRDRLNEDREIPDWRQQEIDHEFEVYARVVRRYGSYKLQDSIISLDWRDAFEALGYTVTEIIEESGYPSTIIAKVKVNEDTNTAHAGRVGDADKGV